MTTTKIRENIYEEMFDLKRKLKECIRSSESKENLRKIKEIEIELEIIQNEIKQKKTKILSRNKYNMKDLIVRNLNKK